MSQLLGDLFAGSFHAPLQLALGYGTGKGIEFVSKRVQGHRPDLFQPIAQIVLNGIACAILKNVVFQNPVFARDPTAGTYFMLGIAAGQPSLISGIGHLADEGIYMLRKPPTVDLTGDE